jgi:hypothetical protein
VLQRIRANWKVISGEPPTVGPAIDGGPDDGQYRLGMVDMEPSPCWAQCGCPDAEWCTRARAVKLRVVPDVDVDVARTDDPNDAIPDRSFARVSDAGMSTVEYAVGTVVAAAFAAVLYKIVTGDSVVAGLTNLINSALSTTF